MINLRIWRRQIIDYLPWIIAVITGAGVAVSFITFWYQRKRFEEAAKAEKDKVQLAGLAEAFQLLNDLKHREA